MADDRAPKVRSSCCGRDATEGPPPRCGVAPAPIDGEGYIDEPGAGESIPRANGLGGMSSRDRGGGNLGLVAVGPILGCASERGESALVLLAPLNGKSDSDGLGLSPSREELASRAMRIFSFDSTGSSTGESVLRP